MCTNETSVSVSIDCFGISIDYFGLSRIKKWTILIKPFSIRDQKFSNFLAKTISVVHSVTKCHSVRFSLPAYQKRKADSESEKTVYSDQTAQKKCKTNSGKFSRISATMVEAV